MDPYQIRGGFVNARSHDSNTSVVEWEARQVSNITQILFLQDVLGIIPDYIVAVKMGTSNCI